MNVSQLTDALLNQVQNGELELNSSVLQSLNDTAIAAIPIDSLLGLLESKGLKFQNVAIAASPEGASIVGDVSLNNTVVRLEAIFKPIDDTYQLNLSAKSLSVYQIPGGLALQNAQIALQASAKTVTGSIAGSIRVGDSEISTVLLVGKVEDEFLFQWTIAEIQLSEIAQTLLNGAEMPPELPNLAFKDVETILKPKSGTFSFKAASAAPINFPANRDGLSITELAIALERSSTQINCNIHLAGDKPLQIANELALKQFELDLELTGKEWKVSGDVTADVFDHEIKLAAAYEQTEAERNFKLSTTAKPAIAIINVEAGHLSVSAFDLEMNKARTEGAEANWSVSTEGSLVISDVVDAQGSLTLAKQDDEISLVFKPDHATVHIQLPPDQSAAMNLEFGEISIVRKPNETTGRSTFVFEAAVDLAFQGFNPTVHKFLPERIATTFKADAQGVTLTANRVLQPFDFVLPDIEISDNASVDLGIASIDVSDLLIRLGKEIEVGAELGIGLPAKLNNLFGVNEDGTAKIQFFNTFDPSDRENTVIKSKLSIGTAGIKIAPASSIIRAIRVVEENGETFWYCTLGENGEFGEVKFKVPEFTFDTARSSFRASGGFEVVKPLALPLTPAKLLLSAVKLQGAADALPESLPLKDVKILDDQNNFKVDELIAELGEVGAKLPQEIKDGLIVIGDRLDQLPDDFKQYLNIEIPDSFEFDIAITPEGTIRFDARVKEGDDPIKVLVPGFLGLLPVLNGISLRSISFGELAAGSLFLLQVDATVDQFDLVTLALSLGLPNIPNNPLPSTRTLHRRLILDKLFMIIVYQTVIPIPVPLFYDEVGIEYLGLEGIQLGAHAQFPMPSLNLAEVGALLSDFKRFFSDRNFLLDPKKPIRDTNLIFSLRKNFIELPQYLGGKQLGDKTDGPEINAYESLARLLNGMKTLSVNEIIQVMPLEKRVGSTDVTFGPFAANAGWLITTPDEFRQLTSATQTKIAPQLGFANDAQAAPLVSVLPSVPNEQGMIVFLRGNAAIANVASFETAFGLAASPSLGFNTGFKIAGKISDVMSMNLSGVVRINGKANPAFQLAGQSRLDLFNQPVFQGDVQISDQRFQCRGSLNLYGLGGNVAMSIDRTAGAEIRGSLNPFDLAVFKLNQADVFIKIQQNQIPTLNARASVELLGIRNTTDITVNNNGFSFSTTGRIFNAFSASLTASGQRLNSTANFRIAATMQNDLTSAIKREATQAIQAAIAQSNTDLSAAQRRVDDAQRQVNTLNSEIATLRQQVRESLAQADPSVRKAKNDVEAARSKVNSMNARIAEIERQINNASFFDKIKLGITLGPELGVLKAGIPAANEALNFAQTILNGALQVARLAVTTGAIDADPRISSRLASLAIATGTLEGAKAFLETLKPIARGVLQASNFIAQRGLDALLLVRAASFEADINSAASGRVTMSVQLSYMDKPSTLALPFNFRDPLSVKSMASAIAQTLVKA